MSTMVMRGLWPIVLLSEDVQAVLLDSVVSFPGERMLDFGVAVFALPE